MAALPVNAAPPSFATFESGQVRPLALTPDKELLLATDTRSTTSRTTD